MVGIVFGCFIPLHKGHLSLVDKALAENDEVIIAVCDYDDDRGKDFIPFSDRVMLMQAKYFYNDRVIVIKLDDRKIGLTGTFSKEAWEIWCNELFKQAGIDPEKEQCTWYTGELSYADKLNQIYPKHNIVVADRHIIINISGTLIRKNFEAYRNLVDKDFRDYLEN